MTINETNKSQTIGYERIGPIDRGSQESLLEESSLLSRIARLVLKIFSSLYRNNDPLVIRSNPKKIDMKGLTERKASGVIPVKLYPQRYPYAKPERVFDTINFPYSKLNISEKSARDDIEKIRHPDALEAKKVLKKIASRVSNAWIHFSGNCDWLAHAFLHTAKFGKHQISVNNHFRNTPSDQVAQHVFGGGEMVTIGTTDSLKDVGKKILDHFRETKNSETEEAERHYLIHSTDYKTMAGTTAHAFNAMVITRQETDVLGGVRDVDYVEFIDPWNKSNQNPLLEELEAKHGSKATFTIEVFENREAASAVINGAEGADLTGRTSVIA